MLHSSSRPTAAPLARLVDVDRLLDGQRDLRRDRQEVEEAPGPYVPHGLPADFGDVGQQGQDLLADADGYLDHRASSGSSSSNSPSKSASSPNISISLLAFFSLTRRSSRANSPK